MRGLISFIKAEKAGSIGLLILLGFSLISGFSPLLTSYEPNQSLALPMLPPDSAHLLGTDELGRDLFSGLIYGGRISLLIGIAASFAAVILGMVIGLISGYYGRTIDDILSRIIDLFLSLPPITFMIVIATILGPSLYKIILVVAITSWTKTARIIRSLTLEVKEREFIEASRSVGASNFHLIFKHIFPVVVPLAIAEVILTIGNAIIAESALSFLGLGMKTHVSWGTILHYAFTEGALSSGAWWYIIPPGLCIMLVILGFTLLGTSIERYLNPSRKYLSG